MGQCKANFCDWVGAIGVTIDKEYHLGGHLIEAIVKRNGKSFVKFFLFV